MPPPAHLRGTNNRTIGHSHQVVADSSPCATRVQSRPRRGHHGGVAARKAPSAVLPKKSRSRACNPGLGDIRHSGPTPPLTVPRRRVGYWVRPARRSLDELGKYRVLSTAAYREVIERRDHVEDTPTVWERLAWCQRSARPRGRAAAQTQYAAGVRWDDDGSAEGGSDGQPSGVHAGRSQGEV